MGARRSDGIARITCTMKLWSTEFLGRDTQEEEWATCTTSLRTWRALTEEHEGARRLIAVIRTPGRGDLYCALGNPTGELEDTESRNHLYIPLWLLSQYGLEGMGEEVEVLWLSENAFPEATRIILRPQDSAFFHGDAKEELEQALTRLGVLTLGQSLQIPLQCLGGYPVALDVVKLEPANVVLAQGEEVALEFEEALDTAAAPAQPRPPTPVPYESEPFGSMLPGLAPAPAPAPAQPSGQRLGGGPTRYMADGRPWNPWRAAPTAT